MPNLILHSLEIQNFRMFKLLQIERLGRVNLFVGKNNVGKSSLLEALQLYAQRGTPSVLWRILTARNESFLPTRFEPSGEAEDSTLDLRHLFFNRPDIRGPLPPIRIGSVSTSGDALTLGIEWQPLRSSAVSGQAPLFDDGEELSDGSADIVGPLFPVLVVQIGAEKQIRYRLDQELLKIARRSPQTNGLQELRSMFIAANGLPNIELARLWDRVTLTNLEQDVLNALRIIAPEVERLSVVGEQAGTRARTPVVRVRNVDDPIPLRSMGEGMNRMLGIALSLAAARDGLLIVDEIESGLHYSVLSDMWRLVFQVAYRLNVQVFATSHSWDCIESFQQAAHEDVQNEGVLIRIERKGGKILPTSFDERELDIVTREQIEVR